MSYKISLFLLLFIWGLTTQAQDEISDTLDIQEVVVTHTKSPLPIRKTVKPVQVIGREVIQQNLGKDFAQLLNEQSGIIVNGAYSNPGKDKSLYLRGAANDYTLILIDGQPVTDPSGVGGVFDPRLFPLDQIERIEILKGAQSTLYGPDAIGGVINIITTQAGKDAFNATGNVGYGSFNTFRGNASINGKTGIIDYSLSIGSYETDGISEAEDPQDTGTFDKDGYSQFNTQAKLGFQVSDAIRIQPFFRYTDFDGNFDDGAFEDAPNTFTSELLNTGLAAQAQLNKGTIFANYSYTSTSRVFDSSFGESLFEGRFNNLDLWLNQSLTDQLQLIGGINFQRVQMLDETTTEVDPSEQFLSPYVNLLLNLPSGLNLEAGLRYNNHSRFGSNVNTSLAASYWLSSNFKAFANFTTGFKAPQLFQLYGAFGANPDLDPQTSTTYEAGVQYGSQGAPLLLRATYFTRNIDEVIAFDFATGYINQDEQNDRGVELELIWKVSDQLRLSGNYTYVTGELTTPNGMGQDTSFNNLIRRPQNSFALSAAYQINDRLLVNAQFQYFDDRDDLFFNPENFFAAEPVVLDSYHLLNIYAEYKLLAERLTIFVDAKNITDQSFNEVYGFSGVGINAMGGVRFSF